MMIRNNTGKILKYAALPGIVPRVKELFGTGFDQLAYLMALIYAMVRLLPPAHPYLNPANVGRYGIVNVIAEAANNLVISRDNIDKIVIFIVLLLGVILLVFQIFTLLFVVATGAGVAQASAGGGNPAPPSGFGELFDTPSKTTDLAHIALDMIFGVTRDGGQPFFESCVGTGAPCVQAGGDNSTLDFAGVNFPWPFHEALHTMFQLYSIGLLVIGIIIFLYFIITIVAETAQSGTPFGKRFNTVWAPIRMIVAFGLLIPMASGLNAGQYITLYAAKWGSGFATNAWERFNETLASRPLYGEGNMNLLARGSTPSMTELTAFMYFAHACKIMRERDTASYPGPVKNNFGAWMVNNQSSAQRLGSAAEVIEYFDGKSAKIIFGVYQDTDGEGTWEVIPVCGSIEIPVKGRIAIGGDALNPPGTRELFEIYIDYVRGLWEGTGPGGGAFSANVQSLVDARHVPDREESLAQIDNITIELVRSVQENLINQINDIYEDLNSNAASSVNERMELTREKGWAGAAIWFNEIARMNGAFAGSILATPRPLRMPQVMEDARAERGADVENTNPSELYCADHTTDEDKINLNSYLNEPMQFRVYSSICEYWQQKPVEGSFSERDGSVGEYRIGDVSSVDNSIYFMINLLFPVEGLFDIRREDNVHPMAKLSFFGKTLIDRTISSVGVAVGMSFGSILGARIPGIGEFVGKMMQGISNFMLTIATIGLAAGFILYYILAFLPFMYFFFAFTGWLKTIFEAMVGVPLWALAHIRIDGDGLPGDAGANGYYLIFEVFIRPILILFGLLLSIVIFTAAADILNEIFDLVVNNVGGNTLADESDPSQNQYKKGPLDQLFFTVMYVIFLYLMGTSAFKAIDLVPKSILRWIGQKDLQSFGDMQSDPLDNLTKYAAIGGQQAFGQVTGGLRGFNG